jgi:hypothetical protein
MCWAPKVDHVLARDGIVDGRAWLFGSSYLLAGTVKLMAERPDAA